jgi:hypothetical protein
MNIKFVQGCLERWQATGEFKLCRMPFGDTAECHSALRRRNAPGADVPRNGRSQMANGQLKRSEGGIHRIHKICSVNLNADFGIRSAASATLAPSLRPRDEGKYKSSDNSTNLNCGGSRTGEARPIGKCGVRSAGQEHSNFGVRNSECGTKFHPSPLRHDATRASIRLRLTLARQAVQGPSAARMAAEFFQTLESSRFTAQLSQLSQLSRNGLPRSRSLGPRGPVASPPFLSPVGSFTPVQSALRPSLFANPFRNFRSCSIPKRLKSQDLQCEYSVRKFDSLAPARSAPALANHHISTLSPGSVWRRIIEP